MLTWIDEGRDYDGYLRRTLVRRILAQGGTTCRECGRTFVGRDPNDEAYVFGATHRENPFDGALLCGGCVEDDGEPLRRADDLERTVVEGILEQQDPGCACDECGMLFEDMDPVDNAYIDREGELYCDRCVADDPPPDGCDEWGELDDDDGQA